MEALRKRSRKRSLRHATRTIRHGENVALKAGTSRLKGFALKGA